LAWFSQREKHVRDNVLAKVRAEKVDRKEFRATLKRKKYDRTKEQLKNVAFGVDDGEADGAVM
jgi:hypothetical protein